MFCNKCGKENKDGSLFCSSCGNPFQSESAEEVATQGTQQVSQSVQNAEATMQTSNGKPLHIVCPKCGSRNLSVTNEVNVQTSGKDFSAGKACLGNAMFGPLGILCGSCGGGKKVSSTNTVFWICNDCGNKFKHFDEMEKEIAKLKTAHTVVIVASVLLNIMSIPTILLSAIAREGSLVTMSVLLSLIMIALPFLTNHRLKAMQNEFEEMKKQMEKFQ